MKLSNKKLSRYKFIFVDYFDTIVTRKVSPEHMKVLWAESMAQKLNYVVDRETLSEDRATAERNLISERQKEVFSFVELCERMWYKLKHQGCDISLPLFEQMALETEEEIELNRQIACGEIIREISELKAQGKKMILVSDFWLGKTSYAKFFGKLGLENFFDEVYISCDWGTCKSDGSLYKTVLNTENVSPKDVAMIGDNKISDYERPRELGIYSICITNRGRERKLARQKSTDQNGKALKRDLYRIARKAKAGGGYAFSLFLFCNSLYKQCYRRGIDTVYFFSREGLFLKQLFDKFMEDKTRKIKTGYLYVSRNSTFLPSLRPLSEEKFEPIFREYKNISVKSFLKALCFTDDEVAALDIPGLDCVIENFKESAEFISLTKNARFAELYEAKRRSARENFSRYLRGEIPMDGSPLCVVDVGWKGSIQDNLFRFFGNGREVIGYYLGLRDFGNTDEWNDKTGLLFDWVTGKDNRIGSDVYAYDWHNYELLLAAGHGRTDHYSDEDGTPILIDDGDTVIYEKYARKYQENIFHTFSSILAAFAGAVAWDDFYGTFEAIHKRMFFHMPWGEVYALYHMNLLHQDGFIDYYGRPKCTLKYLLKGKLRPYFRMKRYYCRKNCILRG